MALPAQKPPGAPAAAAAAAAAKPAAPAAPAAAVPANKPAAAPAKPGAGGVSAALAASGGRVANTAPPAAVGPQNRKLKKGELLFAEGENSRAMYLLKKGMIRLYKKKGDASIELDTVHSGQVLGELAFLDGNPRSASGEALTECELTEISGPTFSAVLGNMPDWLKLLLKTVVGRLRTASTRIRQLEMASTAFDYNDKDGGKKSYVYLGPTDVMKVASAILLVAFRNGTKSGSGYEIKVGLLNRYGQQIMGVPSAKITTLLDVLTQVGIVATTDSPAGPVYSLVDPDFLEQMIAYMNEENLLEPAKRHDVTIKGFLIMSLINKHLPTAKKDPASGMATVNVGGIMKTEAAANGGKEPFRLDDFPELVKVGYATGLEMKSAEEALTQIKVDTFTHAYKLQRIMKTLESVNEQKRKGGGK